MRFSRKAKIGAAAVVASVGVGVAGFAYWTTGGTGTGSATTGVANNITVNQTASSDTLYPGTSTTLSGNFTNANPAPVYITTVSAAIDAFSYPGNTALPPCTDADFTLTTSSVAVGLNILTGPANGPWTGIVLKMNNNLTANQDNCKSVNVPVTYTAS